jgi:mono/diheme cytochrome c family protein
MKIPVGVRLLALILGATAFYTWVGQLVPQKEVQPPKVVELASDMTTQDLVAIGQGIFEGKGLCTTCHTVGKSGGALRFPDLAGVANRAGNRIPGVSAVGYLAQSLYRPNAFIVPGFSPGMPEIDKPPVALTDDEILAVISYLQTLGGTPTVTVDMTMPYAGGGEATPDQLASAGTAGAGAGAAAPAAAQGAGEAAAEEAPATAAGGAAAALLASYGCHECHSPEPGGERSLAGVGARLDRAAIQRWLTDHQPPLPASYTDRVTLADVRSMTDYLTTLKEQG